MFPSATSCHWPVRTPPKRELGAAVAQVLRRWLPDAAGEVGLGGAILHASARVGWPIAAIGCWVGQQRGLEFAIDA